MIRKANISDLDQIYLIYLERNLTEENKNCSYSKLDWKWYIENSGIIYVYEIDSNICGFIFGYDMGLWGYIEHIVVSKNNRGSNIGRQLVNYFIENKFENWEQVELCYELNMDEYFTKIGFKDNQIITKWVHKLI